MSYFFNNLSISQQFLLGYLFVINVTAFLFYALDKKYAEWKTRRISEKELWFLALIGGSLGALLGMHFFRHKTRKMSFQAGIIVIIAIQVFIIFLLTS